MPPTPPGYVAGRAKADDEKDDGSYGERSVVSCAAAKETSHGEGDAAENDDDPEERSPRWAGGDQPRKLGKSFAQTRAHEFYVERFAAKDEGDREDSEGGESHQSRQRELTDDIAPLSSHDENQ